MLVFVIVVIVILFIVIIVVALSSKSSGGRPFSSVKERNEREAKRYGEAGENLVAKHLQDVVNKITIRTMTKTNICSILN